MFTIHTAANQYRYDREVEFSTLSAAQKWVESHKDAREGYVTSYTIYNQEGVPLKAGTVFLRPH